jgi:TrmH family RNA methyltransferase
MPATEKITSLQNPKIKKLKELEKASGRREQGLILIEGVREIALAQRAGYKIETLYVCNEILNVETQIFASLQETGNPKPETMLISKAVYDSLAYRESTEGVIGTAQPKNLELNNLSIGEGLILVIESVEKPGNLGAMLRTCDAAGVDAVIICDPKTDVYNPNVIRSSIGTIFTNQIAVCETADAIKFLKENHIKTFAADLNATKFHYQQNFKRPAAIIVGAEATGLSEAWIKAADEKIKISMLGKIDSLNVSVSAAVLLFEARRQRMA